MSYVYITSEISRLGTFWLSQAFKGIIAVYVHVIKLYYPFNYYSSGIMWKVVMSMRIMRQLQGSVTERKLRNWIYNFYLTKLHQLLITIINSVFVLFC